MFSIGGVTQLKQHPFFDALDWQAVEALEYPPPIDLGAVSQLMANPQIPIQRNGNQAMGGDGHRVELGTPSSSLPVLSAGCGGGSPHVGLLDAFTSHFHEGFTTQSLTPSVVEDCTSGLTSPTGRSRANSGDHSADFANFEYTYQPMECTEDQYKQFEEELSSRLAKAAKKRLHKAKKDEDRIEKQLQLEVS